jgi:hypothetical protein
MTNDQKRELLRAAKAECNAVASLLTFVGLRSDARKMLQACNDRLYLAIVEAESTTADSSLNDSVQEGPIIH